MNLGNPQPTTSSDSTSRPFVSGSTSTPISHETTTQEATTIDSPAYEGIDTINAAGFTPQQFFVKTVYEASAQIPLLLVPDPEGQTGPQPYGSAEQKLVRNFFSKTARELLLKKNLSPEEFKLIYQALLSGKTLSDPRLANLAKNIGEQATATTRDKSHLPVSWNLHSSVAQDWIPLPISAYNENQQKEIRESYEAALLTALTEYSIQIPLSPEQTAKLKAAIETNKISSDTAHSFHAITEIARTEVQKTYGLSRTWYPETTDIENWKPIHLGVVTPLAVSQMRAELIVGNADILLEGLVKSAAKTSQNLPPDDSNQVSLADFVRVIAKAIRDLKQALKEMQIKEAEKSKEFYLVKFDAIKDREKRVEDTQKKVAEMRAKQEKQKKISFWMKIVGPVVAALSTLVGAALALFTFGASLTLVFAGIAVGAALTAYSIVDSVTGVTQNIVAAFNKQLEILMPDNPTLRSIVKFIIVAVIVAALIVAIVATGGGAAASVATQTMAQIAKQAGLEAIKQLSIQAIVMTVMSSNAIPELVSALLIESGALKEDDKKGSQIAQMVVMGMTMLATMAALALGGKGAGVSFKGIATGVKETISSVQQAATRLLDTIKTFLSNVKQGVTEGIQEFIKLLNKMLRDLLQQLQKLPAALQELPHTLKTGINQSAQAVKNLTQELLEQLKNLSTKLKSVPDRVIELIEKFQKALKQFIDKTSEAATKVKVIIAEGLEQAVKKLEEAVKIQVDYLRTIPGRIGQTALEIWEGAKEIGQSYQSISSALLGFQKTLQLSALMIQTADGICKVVSSLKVAQLLRVIGNQKAFEDLMQETIKTFEITLAGFQTAMEDNSEWQTTAQELYNNLFATASRITTKISPKA